MGKEGRRQQSMANVKIYFGKLYQDRTQFSRSTSGKRANFEHANNIKEEYDGKEKE